MENRECRPVFQKDLTPDALTRVFNTALIRSHEKGKKDFSSELSELTQSPPFRALLSTMKQLACLQDITEQEAAEQLIQTFRKLDQIWSGYLLQESVQQLKKRSSS